MDQHTDSTAAKPSATGLSPFYLIAGLAQVAAAFTPAGHVRLVGRILFIRLPTAGIAFVVLGLLTATMALRPRGWWRWIPGLLSAVLLAAVYARLRWSPSGRFVDPVLRHAVRPAWGFVPMALAVLFALGAAALARRVRGPEASHQLRTDA